MSVRQVCCWVGLSLVVSLGACSSMLVNQDQYAGFLPDYTELVVTKSPSGVDVRRWMDPSVNFSSYDSFELKPTVFYPEQEPTAEVSDATLNGITSSMDSILSGELRQSLRQVSTPGNRTLVMEGAITSVTVENATLKVYQYIPIALIVVGVQTATGHRDQDTYLNVEFIVRDGASGKPIAMAVRRLEGIELPNKASALSASNFTKAFQAAAKDVATLIATGGKK